MSQTKDLYAILGVSHDAAGDEIKRAYKKLVHKYHPDLNQGDKAAEDRFKEVAVAFDVLGDDQKRKLYDEFGMDGIRAGFDPEKARAYQQWAGSNPWGGGVPGFGGAGGQGEFDFGSLFEQLFGGQRGGGPKPTGPSRGPNLEATLGIDLEDAARGASRDIGVTKPVSCGECHGSGSRSGKTSQCPTCRGSGRVSAAGPLPMSRICPGCGGTGEAITDPCLVCRGSGTKEASSTLTIKIPPGVGDGSRIRLAGQGAAGERGGPAGDLILQVQVQPHRIFRREGRDVLLEVPLTLPEAMRGGTIEVPTPHGPVDLKIPKRAAGGTRMRIRGKGIGNGRPGNVGDLIVTLRIALPDGGEEEEIAAVLDYLEAHYRSDVRGDLK